MTTGQKALFKKHKLFFVLFRLASELFSAEACDVAGSYRTATEGPVCRERRSLLIGRIPTAPLPRLYS